MSAPNPLSKLEDRNVRSFLTFLILCLFYLLIQAELLVSFYWTNSWVADLKEVIALLFSQSENFMVSIGLSLVVSLLPKNTFIRIAYTLFLSLVLLLIVFNVVYYTTFFDLIRIDGSVEQTVGLELWDSFIASLNPLFYWNIVLFSLSSILLGVVIIPAQLSRLLGLDIRKYPRRSVFFMLGFVIVLGYGLGNKNRNYIHHPLVELGASLILPNQSTDARLTFDPNLDFRDLVHGASSSDSVSERSIVRYLDSTNDLGTTKNILYYIVESVGAVNILDDTALNQELTPHLYSNRRHMAIFPAIYNYFPGTVLSHIPIMTGGSSYTWSNTVDDDYTYNGPTLVKALSTHGYYTSVYSTQFLDFGNLIGLYRNLPLDYLFLPSNQSDNFIEEHKLNSWGLSDIAVHREFMQAMDTVPHPFFSTFINTASHHPYNVPAEYEAPFPTDNNINKHRNTIYLLDDLVGKTISYLRESGELENTIIILTGDHGQAFGDRHRSNFTHRSFLYEENIRNFMLVLDFSKEEGPYISKKRGSIADIMPSILDLAHADIPNLVGQSLFDSVYQERINFFHKINNPGSWGLLDGKWKFIIEKSGENPVLFNLEQDPLETRNIAELHPDKVEFYHSLCYHWYTTMDNDFKSKIDSGELEEDVTDLHLPGPKLMKFGIMTNGEFEIRDSFIPTDTLSVQILLTSYKETKNLEWTAISPSEKRTKGTLPISGNSASVRWTPILEYPLEPGKWDFMIFDGPALMLKESLTVQ